MQAGLDRPRGQRAAVLEVTGAIVDTQWQLAFYANLEAFLVIAQGACDMSPGRLPPHCPNAKCCYLSRLHRRFHALRRARPDLEFPRRRQHPDTPVSAATLA
jgi:hypothetical protein